MLSVVLSVDEMLAQETFFSFVLFSLQQSNFMNVDYMSPCPSLETITNINIVRH